MNKFLRVIKRILCVIGCTFVVVIIAGVLLYVAMVKETDFIVQEIEASAKGDIPYAEVNENLKYYAFHFSEQYTGDEIGDIHFEVDRKFVLHNWQEGYVWILTDERIKTVNDEVFSSGQDIAVLKIKKIDGKWVVVDRKPAMKTFAEVTVPW